MEGIWIPLTIILIGLLIKISSRNSEDKEIFELQEQRRKEELKQLIENREIRNSDAFDKEKWWVIIEKIQIQAPNNYGNFLGLLKDHLRKYSAEDLVKMDTLLNNLYYQKLSYDLLAASIIIFKDTSHASWQTLLNIMMMKGEVFFNQAASNPNLLINKVVENVDGRLVNDILDELYYAKTKKLLPALPVSQDDEKEVIKGNPWKESELPSRYPELWEAFA